MWMLAGDTPTTISAALIVSAGLFASAWALKGWAAKLTSGEMFTKAAVQQRLDDKDAMHRLELGATQLMVAELRASISRLEAQCETLRELGHEQGQRAVAAEGLAASLGSQLSNTAEWIGVLKAAMDRGEHRGGGEPGG